MSNQQIILDYIQTVWNERSLDQLERFVSQSYVDHSFIPAVPPTRDGLKLWIQSTSKAFDHRTKVEAVVADDDQVAVRVSFHAKHIGEWRGIKPNGVTVVVRGFRFFQLRDGKIIAHWGMIDGEGLQTALTNERHGCSLAS
ncbi:MAG TPA: ester cyclase [Chryseosolibacter sp.]